MSMGGYWWNSPTILVGLEGLDGEGLGLSGGASGPPRVDTRLLMVSMGL